MAVFRPKIGTKTQLSSTSVSNGQFIVVTDQREIYVDHNGSRMQVAASPFDAESLPPSTRPAVLYAVNGVIRSIPMGAEGEVLTVKNGALAWGRGSGESGIAVEATSYAVFPDQVEQSNSISGGSASDGLTQIPSVEIASPTHADTQYQIFR